MSNFINLQTEVNKMFIDLLTDAFETISVFKLENDSLSEFQIPTE